MRGYYQNTCDAINEAIESRYSGCKPDENASKINMPAYLLWMVEKIKQMDRYSLDDATKAARWIGWMLCQMELLGFWDNMNSRDLVRSDVIMKNHIPAVSEFAGMCANHKGAVVIALAGACPECGQGTYKVFARCATCALSKNQCSLCSGKIN